jgi:molecular chaperone DnaK (HSP70)
MKMLWGRSGNRCAICRRELDAHALVSADDPSVGGDMAHVILPIVRDSRIIIQFCRLKESTRGITQMKRMSFLATVAAALLAFSACDKKTSDDLKQKAEDAKQTVETKAKEAKEAADRQIEKAKPKLKELGDKAKEATKDAQPKLEELGKKAKDATQDAIEKTKKAAGSAVENLKNATSASPAGASPTPTP